MAVANKMEVITIVTINSSRVKAFFFLKIPPLLTNIPSPREIPTYILK